MFGSQALEVAIGLTLVFLLVSLVLTAVREGIEAVQKTRAADLEKAIAELLGDRDGTGLRKKLYEHPLIFALFRGDAELTAFDSRGNSIKRPESLAVARSSVGGDRGSFASPRGLPSYIPRELFSTVVMDLLGEEEISGPFRTAYDALLRTSGGDVVAAQKGIERWFDAAMDRAAGWYKRRSQFIVGVLGLVLALLLNINAVTVGRYLATNEAARAQAVTFAEGYTPPTDPGSAEQQAANFYQGVKSLDLPIGWGTVGYQRINERMVGDPANIAFEILLLIAGYLIVGFAATLGAPFWFDVLGKIMVVRSTVKPTEKSPDEKSKDQGTGGAPSPAPAAAIQPTAADVAMARPVRACGPAVAADCAGGGDEPVEFG